MKLLHRQLSRFAVFEVENEKDALATLQRAFRGMYEDPPAVDGFSEDGWLVSQNAAREIGDREEGTETEDQTIYLSNFASGSQMLSLELFNDALDPVSPLNEDNIMLASRLESMCE